MKDTHPGPILSSGTLLSRAVAFTSIALLFISCVDDGLPGNIAKVLWLFSIAVLSVMDLGAAFGVLIVSVVIYNPKHVWLSDAFIDRLDNFGLIIIALVSFVSRTRVRDLFLKSRYLVAMIGLFIFIALARTKMGGSLTLFDLAEFGRSFGIPFLFFLILRWSAPTLEEMRSFAIVMLILAIYLTAVSILERLDLYSMIIPYWIGNRTVNSTIGNGRSGGPFLQSEFNGLALGLIYCIILGKTYLDDRNIRPIAYAAACLCLVGIFLTYTRAAWVGVGLATLVLVLKPPPAGERWVTLKRCSVVVMALIVLGAFFLFPTKSAEQRFTDEDTVYFRANLWATGLSMVRDQPVLGHGLGRFETNVANYQTAVGFGPKVVIPKEGAGAHNIFMTILVEQGGIGLMLYLLIVLRIYTSAYTSGRLIWPRAAGTWIAAFTIVYLVNAQFLNAHEPATNLIYFGTMGMIAGLTKQADETMASHLLKSSEGEGHDSKDA